MQLYGIATMNKLKLNVCWITVLTWFSLGLKLLLPLGYLYTVSPNLSASPLPFLHLSTLSLIFSDYVYLTASSLDNAWTSRPVRALVAPGLCTEILLGLPFLVHNKIVV